jgi:hypothetical protein
MEVSTIFETCGCEQRYSIGQAEKRIAQAKINASVGRLSLPLSLSLCRVRSFSHCWAQASYVAIMESLPFALLAKQASQGKNGG